jgi:hypothetical protein
MKSRSVCAAIAASFLCLFLSLSASAREMVLPAGTLLKCTMDEPNFSTATVAVGDPVLCHLRSVTEFGQQAFPRGSYLVGHLEAAKEPGHFVGKGYLKLVFDRIGMPQGDMPLDAKVIATRGYKVDKDGDIRGKGHATRDAIEWMIPPLWPWKIIMLPARGPRPTLKGETPLELRLMDDVEIPQMNASNGPDWHFFGRPRMENDGYYYRGSSIDPSSNGQASYSQSSYGGQSGSSYTLTVRRVSSSEPPVAEEMPPQVTYASYVTKGPASAAAPGVPVFVLKSGMMLEVGNYIYQDGRINYELAAGGTGCISSDEVDWTTTTRLNNERGVRVMLRPGHPGEAGY